MAEMTKDQALAEIKTLRDKINDVPDPTEGNWRNEVCFHLDAASDVIEFPKQRQQS